LAIAWTLAQPGVTHALVGARNVMQVEGNARASEVRLTSDDMDRIARALDGFEFA
jgi:aryl-alcohol dehydrogenase-like predicted oxidoreductase